MALLRAIVRESTSWSSTSTPSVGQEFPRNRSSDMLRISSVCRGEPKGSRGGVWATVIVE